jgi:serine phosphatase RsbU (regulator of sigma subunit)/anti-sigma regulatory factor (Ser/Thr protein kinase)
MQEQKRVTTIEMLEGAPRAYSAAEEDLCIARKIQAAMVPQRLPAIEGLEMASLYLPSCAVGGDLFDVIAISEDILALYIFDVAGQGVSAALISSMAKVSFSDHVRCLSSPRLVMERVNAHMIQSVSADYYLTAIVAYLDLHDNKLTYCNAGHAYPIIYRRDERTLDALPSTGVFVGVTDQGFYEEKNLYLNSGDWLFFFTDGIYRIFSNDDELLGRKLLEKEIITTMNNGSPASFVGGLRKLHDQKSPGGDPDDDVTAIAIEFLTQSRKNQIKEKLGFKSDDPVYLQFISYFEEMDKAAAVILSSMDSLGYPDENIRKMKIILTELFANAIYHGNVGNHSKKVTVGHIINKKKVVVSIMDEGKGFDPATIPDPTLPENLVKDCGRGLFIVRSYVDKLEFNGAGTRVTVVKNHGGRPSQV